jgi:hypothetical protein
MRTLRKSRVMKVGAFKEFQKQTLAIVRGKRVSAGEPKVWCEPVGSGAKRDRPVQVAQD